MTKVIKSWSEEFWLEVMGKKLDPVDWRVLSKQMLNWACFYPTSVLNTQSGQNTDYKIPNLANSQFIPFWAFWLR